MPVNLKNILFVLLLSCSIPALGADESKIMEAINILRARTQKLNALGNFTGRISATSTDTVNIGGASAPDAIGGHKGYIILHNASTGPMVYDYKAIITFDTTRDIKLRIPDSSGTLARLQDTSIHLQRRIKNILDTAYYGQTNTPNAWAYAQTFTDITQAGVNPYHIIMANSMSGVPSLQFWSDVSGYNRWRIERNRAGTGEFSINLYDGGNLTYPLKIDTLGNATLAGNVTAGGTITVNGTGNNQYGIGLFHQNGGTIKSGYVKIFGYQGYNCLQSADSTGTGNQNLLISGYGLGTMQNLRVVASTTTVDGTATIGGAVTAPHYHLKGVAGGYPEIFFDSASVKKMGMYLSVNTGILYIENAAGTNVFGVNQSGGSFVSGTLTTPLLYANGTSGDQGVFIQNTLGYASLFFQSNDTSAQSARYGRIIKNYNSPYDLSFYSSGSSTTAAAMNFYTMKWQTTPALSLTGAVGNAAIAGTLSSGAHTLTGTIGPTGSVSVDAAYGLVLYGKAGSTSDLALLNRGGSLVMTNTGNTQNVNFLGNATISGTGTNTIKGNMTFASTKQIGSDSATPGVMGTGWFINQNATIPTQSYMEIDNIRVRNNFNTHYFTKDVVKVIGNKTFMTRSGLVYKEMSDRLLLNTSKSDQLADGDLIEYRDGQGTFVQATVSSHSYGTAFDTYYLSFTTGSYDDFNVGGTVAVVSGNSILLDGNAPTIDMFGGVTAFSDLSSSAKVKVRIGALGGMVFNGQTIPAGTNGIYTTDGYFNGQIVSSSGKIGGWTINPGSITKSGGTSAYTGMRAPNSASDVVFFAGGTDTTGQSAPFRVTAAGQVYATSITLSGYVPSGGAAGDVNNGSTTINGGKITTGTVTLSSLNFTPVQGSNVIASINASAEGIAISGSKITIDGTCQFANNYNPNAKINQGGAAADVNTGTTTINGGKITANSITVSQLATSGLSADAITTGTLSADRIGAGTISASVTFNGNIILNGSGGQARLWGDYVGGNARLWASADAVSLSGTNAITMTAPTIYLSGNASVSGNVSGTWTGNKITDSYIASAAKWDAKLSSESDPTISAWAKAAVKPSYSMSEISGSLSWANVSVPGVDVLSNYLPNTYATISALNGKANTFSGVTGSVNLMGDDGQTSVRLSFTNGILSDVTY